MVLTKVCHEAKCDVCGEMAAQHYETQKDFICNLRSEGWSISNKASICPKCKKVNNNTMVITTISMKSGVKA